MIKLKDILTEEEEVQSNIILPADKIIVLQAGTEEHNRGLIVKWRSDGGYDVAYWYGTPDNIVPAELKGDGKSFGDIKNVWLGYHPEIDEGKLSEKIKGIDGKACWDGYRYAGTKDGKDKCIKVDEINMTINEVLNMELIDENITEAKFKGKTVTLNKPTRGDSKKFKVYVNSGKKNADGSIKVKKVNFGHGGTSAKRPTMKIRKSNPKARKAFRARFNCDKPGPKTMARYWSCKKW